jgi:serine phosphatase RsbU (regulator of sigma subunit)
MADERPSQKRPAPKAGSSSRVQLPGPKATSSSRIPAAAPTRRMPREAASEGAEIVASEEDLEVSSVRQKVGTHSSVPKGLSLRWKIVVAMSAVTVLTALLIFVVVFNKAMAQLSREIDAKGVRLCRLLSHLDGAYWRAAIGGDKDTRRKQLDGFLFKAAGGRDPEAAEKLLRVNPELKELYDKLLDPLGELKPLKGGGREYGPGSSILQIAVLDRSVSDGGSVQAVDGYGDRGITLFGNSRRTDPTGVVISDGRDKASHEEVRLYTFEKAMAGTKMQFSVILSAEAINAARGDLRTSLLLPVLVAILLGTGIAYWISTRITNPVKSLMHDMTEVSGGNLEHQTRARSTDEIGQLAFTFNKMTQALRTAHQQELESRALEHDLAIASEIQSNLVPKRMLKLPGCDVGAYYRPSKEVGGDYYDFIEIDEDNEGIVVADVSGKGIPGSLVMTMARAFIRMEAERSRNTSPADTLIRANRMLAQDIKKGMFVTGMYAIINKQTHELRVASAGHNPMLVWRAATNRVELVNPNGIALGFDKGPVFERSIKEERVVLERGDRIVLYTDGTVEAMDAQNREYGDDRFAKLVSELAQRDSNQFLNLLVKDLDAHRGSAPQSDDITIVTLRYL